MYDPFMEKKAHVIALSKLDTVAEDERDDMVKKIAAKFKKEFKEDIIGISSVSGYRLPELKRILFDLIQKNK
jgi:GTP-binding protein EngB required for normal cell division